MIPVIGAKKALMILLTFFVGLMLWGPKVAQTMAFTGFIFYEFVRLFVIRYEEGTSYFANKWLDIALLVSVVMQLLVLYYAPFASVFGVVPLTLAQLAVIAGFTFTGLLTGLLLAWVLMKTIPLEEGYGRNL